MNDTKDTSAMKWLGDSSCKDGNPREQSQSPESHQVDDFVPVDPSSLEEAGLTTSEIESLILKYLLVCVSASGRKITDQIKLPFGLTKGVLQRLKSQLMIVHKASAAISDYEYALDEAGLQRARQFAERSTYCGAAPVSLKQYLRSVQLQPLRNIKLSFEDYFNAYRDLSLSPSIVSQIGQAANANRSLLLYGAAGNGKTSVARRIIHGVDQPIWIPRTLCVGGEIIRLYDSSFHEEIPLKTDGPLLAPDDIDRRWVRIKRPTIVVGAELTLENLEFKRNRATGIIESSLQLKSNGGALVIDDFGRQAVDSAELLIRLIVPLERGYDFFVMPSGMKVQVPFDQLLVFATNLDPRKLFDEALLHRIPYKIEMPDPTEEQFRDLFQTLAPTFGFAYCEQAVKGLIENHFRAKGRPFRYCLVGELLRQVKSFCEFHDRPQKLTAEAFEGAAENFFAGL